MDKKKIELGEMDACVVWRENGRVELVLPNRPGKERVPPNCMLASMAAMTFKDILEVDEFIQWLEEKRNEKKVS